ncbi:MAG: zinc ribbon domain-containing protein [Clostridiales Family XIII bacterium]|jgi:hypothetical protein|nr:zinc ribbon domain-containing protein [Clostridiales Family XIII bacterium]
MKYCPNCGVRADEGAAFCHECGASLTDEAFSQGELYAEASFIPEAAAYDHFVSSDMPSAEGETDDGGEALFLEEDIIALESTLRKRKFKTLAIIAGILAVMTAVGIFVLPVLLNWEDEDAMNNPGLFYLKGGEVFFSANLTGEDAVELTTNLDVDADTFNDLGTNSFLYNSQSRNGIAQCSLITVDSKESKALYIDEAEAQGEKSLYVRVLNKKNEKAKKVDSSIIAYQAAPNLKKVLYLKGSMEPVLYLSDFEEKSEIDKNVKSFACNEDLTVIIYDKNGGGICVKSGNAEKTVLDGNGQIAYVSPDLKKVFFFKMGAEGNADLCLWREGGEITEIAQDVSIEGNYFFETGQAYYVTQEERVKTMLDYVNDDLKEQDDAMKEPKPPEYPEEPDYPGYWATPEETQQYEAEMAAYEVECDQYEEKHKAYEEDMIKYQEKLARDDLRADLAASERPETVRILHYFDGQNSTNVTEQFGQFYASADNAAIATYVSFYYDEAKKKKLSEIKSEEDVSAGIQDGYTYSDGLYLAVNGQENLLPRSTSVEHRFSWDGSHIWYFGEYSDEKETGVVFRAKISDKTVAEPEQFDIDVTSNSFYIAQDESVIYFKNYNESLKIGDCYINGTLVDKNVAVNSLAADKEWKVYYYLADYNPNSGSGILKQYIGGQDSEIAKDVRSFMICKAGETVVLENYSFEKKTGDLTLYDAKKNAEVLDTDVSAIIPVRNVRDRYSYVRDLAFFSEKFYFDIPQPVDFGET